MAVLTPKPMMQFFDSNGDPLAGGKLYTYEAGTTTPLATYTDQGGATPNTNPVILDSRGMASVWLGTEPYKFVLYDANDVLQPDGGDNIYPIQISPQIDYIGNYGDLASAVTAIGSTQTTLLINEITTISDGVTVTIPSTLSLWFTDEGKIQGTAGGGTETLAGIVNIVNTGPYQIFGDDLTITATINAPQKLVEWWGVVPNNNSVRAANTTALERALDTVSDVWFTTTGVYYFESFTPPNSNHSLNGAPTGNRVTAPIELDFSPTGSIGINYSSALPLSVHSKIQGLNIVGPDTKTGIYIDQNGIDMNDVHFEGWDKCAEIVNMVGQNWKNISLSSKTKSLYLNTGATGYISNNHFDRISVFNDVSGATSASTGLEQNAVGGGVIDGNVFTALDAESVGIGIKNAGVVTSTFIAPWIEALIAGGAGVEEQNLATCTSIFINPHYDAGAGAALTYSDKSIVYQKNIIRGNLDFRSIGGIVGTQTDANAWQSNANYPLFSATLSTNQLNIVPGSGANTILFDTELHDRSGDFASNTFTAPADFPANGVMHFDLQLYLIDIDSACTQFTVQIVTPNRTFTYRINPSLLFSADPAYYSMQLSVDAKMSAGHTAYAVINITDGATQTDISTLSTFSGHFLP